MTLFFSRRFDRATMTEMKKGPEKGPFVIW